MKNAPFLKFAPALILLAVILIFATSCKKDEEPEPQQVLVEENGLTKDINELVPADVLAQMEELGMPINRGGSPPDISGVFRAASFILKESNIESDFIGFKYPDFRVQFSNYNRFALRINVDYINGFEQGSGLGGFIVGEGNDFSVFAEIISERESQKASFAYVISGTMSDNGIEDMHVANFILDDNGDPDEIWIEVGEGRVLYDSDGLSEPENEL